MILILIAIIVSAVISCVLIKYSDCGYDLSHSFSGFFGFLLAFISASCAILYAFVVWNYIADEYKAEIINREYGTNYTRDEVFYAADVIDTIRDLDRKRYEFNGNLMRGNHEK